MGLMEGRREGGGPGHVWDGGMDGGGGRLINSVQALQAHFCPSPSRPSRPCSATVRPPHHLLITSSSPPLHTSSPSSLFISPLIHLLPPPLCSSSPPVSSEPPPLFYLCASSSPPVRIWFSGLRLFRGAEEPFVSCLI